MGLSATGASSGNGPGNGPEFSPKDPAETVGDGSDSAVRGDNTVVSGAGAGVRLWTAEASDEFWAMVDAGLVDPPPDGFGDVVLLDELDDMSGDDAPPVPTWVTEAEAEREHEDLLAAADHPAGLGTAQALALIDPEALAAVAFRQRTVPEPPPRLPSQPSSKYPAESPSERASGAVSEAPGGPAGEETAQDAAGALVSGLKAAHRLVNHYQALEQRYIAALTRPGVAAPLEGLVDMCLTSGAKDLRKPIATELPDDLPTDSAGEVDLRPLLVRPAWAPALRDAAAKVASVEVGCALRIAPITARMRTEKAAALVDQLPATLTAQQHGDVDGYRASIIADRTAVLEPGLRRQVERTVLAYANARTPGVLRDLVDREVIAADPGAAERRVTEAKKRRGVTTFKDDDGMSIIRGLLAAEDASMIYGVLDEIAASVHAGGHAAGRGRSQIRADALSDLFGTLAETGHAHLTGRPTNTARHTATAALPFETAEPGKTAMLADTANSGAPQNQCGEVRPPHQPTGRLGQVAGYRTSVGLNVYIHAATLAGFDDQPGELTGYGTITAATARALAASATTVRALIVSDTPGLEDLSDPDRPRRNNGGHDPGDGHSRGIHSSHPVRRRACDTTLDAGRAVYRPPDATADYVTARDRTCQFPGCRTAARRCDIDHRMPFDHGGAGTGDAGTGDAGTGDAGTGATNTADVNAAETGADDSNTSDVSIGGATCPCNLDVLCRFHHHVKTFTPWRAEPGPDGTLIWASPAAQHYQKEPAHVLRDPLPHNKSAHGSPSNNSTAPGRLSNGRLSNGRPINDNDPPPF